MTGQRFALSMAGLGYIRVDGPSRHVIATVPKRIIGGLRVTNQVELQVGTAPDWVAV